MVLELLFVSQFKKPPIPVRHCKDDRTQGTREQGKSMNTAYVGKRYTGLNYFLAIFTHISLSINLA